MPKPRQMVTVTTTRLVDKKFESDLTLRVLYDEEVAEQRKEWLRQVLRNRIGSKHGKMGNLSFVGEIDGQHVEGAHDLSEEEFRLIQDAITADIQAARPPL